MERYQNLGAVAVLKGPEWDDPDFVQFDAVHPRPDVAATYEVSPCQFVLVLMQPEMTRGRLEAHTIIPLSMLTRNHP